MYSIRLELGKETEDRRFMEYQKQLDEQEAETAARMRKNIWYAKRISYLSVFVGLFIACIVMLVKDISLLNKLSDIRAEIAKRPVFTEAHPIVDYTVREEIEAEERAEEERKSAQYEAVDAAEMLDLGEDIRAEFEIVVNTNDNTVVASRKGRAQMVPASMTKVMTLLVAVEHLTKEQLDDTVVVTPDVIQYKYDHDCSSVGFLENEVVPVRDLLYGTILPSGADAAICLANYVAGSHVEFVDMMNEKLETLGLAETSHFTNCVGLYDDKHYSTCYDMAMIMHAAIDNPVCREVLSTKIYTTTPTAEHPEGIELSNWFLRRIEDKPCGADVACAKTGYVKQSGNCAVSFATDSNGNDYICVTGNCPGNWKCIYDHVRTYRKIFPEYDSSQVNTEQEEAEYAGEVSDH